MKIRERKPESPNSSARPRAPIRLLICLQANRARNRRTLGKISKKRKLLQTDDESLVTIDELIKRKKNLERFTKSFPEILKGSSCCVKIEHEVKNGKDYVNSQRAFNLDVKQVPSLSLENHQAELINSIDVYENQDENQVHCMVHHQPSAVDPTVDGPQTNETFQHPCAQISPVLPSGSGSGSGKAHDMGPPSIDLNVPAEAACR
ncbi:uncharacterized protein LOC130787438 isoform X2 [Actinidia eriantha]|uniref:uncharacterized protein LOC130787438 isoform X2 n=1 Tax=Actinidia eriantha TaxID=165200 RepID=UPI002583FCED|nr:uncharacterized protein LOC130787438 isoform X2 [Actinidia eriantha]